MKNKFDVFESKFAQDIFLNRYSLNKQETWKDTCTRVVSSVCGQYLTSDQQEKIFGLMYNRIFIPGGRYLAAAGRPLHQIANCFCLRADDSREGWAELLYKATMMLSTGGGIGVEYSNVRPKGELIKKTGGIASGPISLIEMVNEVGRHIRSGGDRRSAIWAGLNWAHKDIFSFLTIKNRTELQQTITDTEPLFPMPLDGTNISVVYDSEFFRAIENETHPLHELALKVWGLNCKQAFSTAEPGFSFNFLKDSDNLRNACQPSFARFLKETGVVEFRDVNVGDRIWTGDRWTTVIKKWSNGVKPVYKYTFTSGSFIGTEDHKVVLKDGSKKEIDKTDHIIVYGGPDTVRPSYINQQDVMDGLVIGDGGVHKESNNLVGLYIGKKDNDYFNDPIKDLILKFRPGISPYFHEIRTTITKDELPKTFNRKVPDRFYYGTLETKCGFLRGLFSANGNALPTRVCLKQSSRILIDQVQEMLNSIGIRSYITTNKRKKIQFKNGIFESKESYDLNVSSDRLRFFEIVGFIQRYKKCTVENIKGKKYTVSKLLKKEYLGEHEVFDITVDDPEHLYWTGGCLVSNCTEFTSDEDSDSCNLGSIYINKIKTKSDMAYATKYATAFLLCGGIYTDCPTPKVREVRDRNNRIGLGLGGIAEWMARHSGEYSVSEQLHKLLNVWKQESDSSAYMVAKELGIAVPKSKRALAPNGTTSIIAGTTGGIEPIYCKSYKRRYYDSDKYKHQFIVDPVVKKLLDDDIPLSKIQDAYDISFKTRVKVQADIQQYVDMAISSTCNLPKWGDEKNNETTLPVYSDLLLKYAKRLRGFTCYPDASRKVQPLERCDVKEAMENEGKVFESIENSCGGSVCGI